MVKQGYPCSKTLADFVSSQIECMETGVHLRHHCVPHHVHERVSPYMCVYARFEGKAKCYIMWPELPASYEKQPR